MPKHHSPSQSLTVDLESNAANYTSQMITQHQNRYLSVPKRIAIQHHTAKNMHLLEQATRVSHSLPRLQATGHQNISEEQSVSLIGIE